MMNVILFHLRLGNFILSKTDKGRYANTDMYMMHVYPVDEKNYLMLTNQSVIYVSRSEILHDWESNWKLSFGCIKGNQFRYLPQQNSVVNSVKVISSGNQFRYLPQKNRVVNSLSFKRFSLHQQTFWVIFPHFVVFFLKVCLLPLWHLVLGSSVNQLVNQLVNQGPSLNCGHFQPFLSNF